MEQEDRLNDCFFVNNIVQKCELNDENLVDVIEILLLIEKLAKLLNKICQDK